MTTRISRRNLLATGTGLWLAGIPLSQLVSSDPASRPRFTANRVSRPQSDDDIAYLTIAQAAKLIENKELSPVELVDACLKRIERFDGAIKAWVRVLDDRAHAEARKAADEIARRGPRSPLHGIPIAHKDLYDVKGLPTKAGSKVRSDAPPAKRDAAFVRKLRNAGAVMLGKTTTHEFAYGTRTPPTANPWDTSRIPGGSSGGSAAALASGMCLGASGSDTGGSIRTPSSLCNVVGIKPTFGRVSKDGLLPLAWTLDHAGPLARSVEDCALMLNVIAGADPRDPTTAAAPVPDFTRALGKSVRNLKVGVPTSVFFEGADPETERLVRKALRVLESLGVHVVPLEMPKSQRVAGTSYVVIQTAEPREGHEYYLRRRPEAYDNQTRALLALGQEWTAQDYLHAQRIRTVNIRSWVKIFHKIDAVASPATPRPAPTKEEGEVTGVFDLANYAPYFDFNGCPSMSVPAGFTRDGLPVGLMLSAPPFGEVKLLRLAYAYQEETRFNRRRPPLAKAP